MASEVVSLLDFDHGARFEAGLARSQDRGIHDHHNLNKNQFHLLATFRRHLFQLNEDSVALALQSCLGGTTSDFLVTYQSHNHFKFTVSCKSVVFEIYNLCRFIGHSFDVYFHLCSNGAPHWEREKRLWEEEEAKEWSKVLSKKQKRAVAKASEKRIQFSQNLVQQSPKIKSRPREVISGIY